MALGSLIKSVARGAKKTRARKKPPQEKSIIKLERATSPQREATSKAKKAKRGVQADKVEATEKRLLPSTPARKTAIDKMSSSDIAMKFTGKEISAMQRKFKDPKVLKKLKQAREKRKDLVYSTDDLAVSPTKKKSLEMQFRKGGGQIKSSRPKGVGAAQRGWGATGKH